MLLPDLLGQDPLRHHAWPSVSRSLHPVAELPPLRREQPKPAELALRRRVWCQPRAGRGDVQPVAPPVVPGRVRPGGISSY